MKIKSVWNETETVEPGDKLVDHGDDTHYSFSKMPRLRTPSRGFSINKIEFERVKAAWEYEVRPHSVLKSQNVYVLKKEK
jgi:hypothetical protein